MAKVMKVVGTVRNNWKKSLAGTLAAYYGVNYAKDSYDCHQMMREYCESAKQYGEVPTPVDARQRHVTVILNPAANRRKAKKEFEQYCAPLLHLAGLIVNVVQTGGEGQARNLTEKLEEGTDALIIAGGDGTLSEVVTGLLRRPDGTAVVRKLPLGVLPLGRTNSVARQFFDSAHHVRSLAEATMAIICEATTQIDAIRIDVLPTEKGTTTTQKPVFSLVGVEWGAFRDTVARRDKYWYFGPLKDYASYVFTGMKDETSGITWQCQAKVEYKPPCAGCSHCFSERVDLQPEPAVRRSWWTAFTRRQPGPAVQRVDYSKVINESCGQQKALDINTTELCVLSSNVVEKKSQDTVPFIQLSYGLTDLSYMDFVTEGWRRVNGEQPLRPHTVQAQEVKIWPLEHSAGHISDLHSSERTDTQSENPKTEEKERWFSIDSEDYEVRAIHAKLLPNAIKIFCPPQVQAVK